MVSLKELVKKGTSVSEKEKEEFVALTTKLIDLMVDFSILTLRTFRKMKSSELTVDQVEDVINFDLQFRIQQIQDPEFLDIVRKRVTRLYKD